MKDALHGEPQVMVVAIDDPRVLRSAGGTDVLSGREQRFDGRHGHGNLHLERENPGSWIATTMTCG